MLYDAKSGVLKGRYQRLPRGNSCLRPGQRAYVPRTDGGPQAVPRGNREDERELESIGVMANAARREAQFPKPLSRYV